MAVSGPQQRRDLRHRRRQQRMRLERESRDNPAGRPPSDRTPRAVWSRSACPRSRSDEAVRLRIGVEVRAARDDGDSACRSARASPPSGHRWRRHRRRRSMSVTVLRPSFLPRPSLAARPMRCSLPVAPFGISARITILRGTLKSASAPADERRAARARRGHGPPRSTTAARDLLAQLVVRHGEGHALRPRQGDPSAPSSTSSGLTFSPPRLMISFRRPVRRR